jgi:hypothetical protein
MKLQHLQQKTLTTHIEIDGEKLNYTYYHRKITPALVAALATINVSSITPDAIRAIADHVVALIKEWDLLDGEIPFPLDAERISNEIDINVLYMLIGDMLTKARGTKGEATATDAPTNTPRSVASSFSE